MVNWLPQPGLFHHRIQKSMREKFNPLIKSYGTRTDPDTELTSISLLPFSRALMQF